MSWNTAASDLILSHIRSLTAKYNSAGTSLQRRRLASEISENYSELIRKAPPQEAATYQLQATYWSKKSTEIEMVETADEGPTENSLLFTPRVQYNEIGGYQRVKNELRKSVVLAQALPQFRSNILLYGPPGTGKTLLANGIATEIRSQFYLGTVAGLASKYFGEASRNIEALYSSAQANSPSIVFLDEIETIAGTRGLGHDATDKMITSILTVLDGTKTKKNLTQPVTIAATNLPWMLDPALLSRFDKRIYIGLPTERSIADIIRINLRGFTLDKSMDLKKLSKTCRHRLFAGRDLEALCRSAVGNMINTVNKDFDTTYVNLSDEERAKFQLRTRPVSEYDFAVAMEKIKPTITQGLLNKYDEWRSQS